MWRARAREARARGWSLVPTAGGERKAGEGTLGPTQARRAAPGRGAVCGPDDGRMFCHSRLSVRKAAAVSIQRQARKRAPRPCLIATPK